MCTEVKSIEFMELKLDPVIPVTRVVNGHNVFNKGYRHGIRGKTYEEYYGEEIGRKKREKMSKKMKGHPYWSNNKAAAKPCVVIYQGKLLGRFDSVIEASRVLGMNYATIRRYLKRKIKNPKNGWKWFYEDESRIWGVLIKQ